MSIKVGDKISFVTSEMDPRGIEVFSSRKIGKVEKVLQDDSGSAYVVRRKGVTRIILDTQVKS